MNMFVGRMTNHLALINTVWMPVCYTYIYIYVWCIHRNFTSCSFCTKMAFEDFCDFVFVSPFSCFPWSGSFCTAQGLDIFTMNSIIIVRIFLRSLLHVFGILLCRELCGWLQHMYVYVCTVYMGLVGHPHSVGEFLLCQEEKNPGISSLWWLS